MDCGFWTKPEKRGYSELLRWKREQELSWPRRSHLSGPCHASGLPLCGNLFADMPYLFLLPGYNNSSPKIKSASSSMPPGKYPAQCQSSVIRIHNILSLLREPRRADTTKQQATRHRASLISFHKQPKTRSTVRDHTRAGQS